MPETVVWERDLNESSLREVLPGLLSGALWTYLPAQRWYGEKGRQIAQIEVERPDIISSDGSFIALTIAHIEFTSGDAYRYFVPVLAEAGRVNDAIVQIEATNGAWSLINAPGDERFRSWIWRGIHRGESPGRFRWHLAESADADAIEPPSRVLTGEQSNTNVAFGDQVLVKLFRRVQPGLNPDVELGEYLSQDAGLDEVPRVLGDLRFVHGDGSAASIAIAQEFLSNANDGWSWLGEQLVRSGDDIDLRSDIQIAIRELGAATARIHLGLADAREKDLRPFPITDADITRWTTQTQRAVESILQRIEIKLPTIEHEQARIQAEALIGYREQLLKSLAGYESLIGLYKTRVHGDYHLGQTLHRNERWFVIDFEGEPARPLTERRERYSPLKDVAGMLRSLGYARAFSTNTANAWTDPARTLERVFLAGYRAGIFASPLAAGLLPLGEEAFAAALRPWIIDKAIYEIAYELDNRPDWLWVPITSLFAGDDA